MKIRPSAFWDFSLAVYPREGVESACLELQERHRLDVNLVLFCCWVGASGRGVLEDDDLDRLLAATEPWQKEVVWPIRDQMLIGIAQSATPIRMKLGFRCRQVYDVM